MKANNKAKLIRFNNMSQYKEISHCFTTRLGGVSDGVFSSLNMGFGRGDSDENVHENFELVAKAMEMDVHNFVLSAQVHKDNIRIITKDDIGKGLFKKSDIIGVDGFITNEKGIGLVTYYADCVPIYLYDPVNQVVGICHAGWRGTVIKIPKTTVNKMTEHFGSNPSEIIAAIGPSAGVCCYEVGEEVKKQFELSLSNDIIAKVVKNGKKENKYYIDLKETNKQVLKEAGLMPENIEVSSHCTICESDTFFSHRVMGAERGSGTGIIGLKA